MDVVGMTWSSTVSSSWFQFVLVILTGVMEHEWFTCDVLISCSCLFKFFSELKLTISPVEIEPGTSAIQVWYSPIWANLALLMRLKLFKSLCMHALLVFTACKQISWKVMFSQLCVDLWVPTPHPQIHGILWAVGVPLECILVAKWSKSKST